VYRIDAGGTETVLHTFTGGTDGYQPTSGVTLDSARNLYGATSTEGANQNGGVFKIGLGGQGTVLHSFSGWIDALKRRNLALALLLSCVPGLYRSTRI
jgi:uncharacterized repeat protein (TIGR03803 family)